MQQSAIVMQPVQQFDSNDPDYRCCSGTCHVMGGAMLIGLIETITVAISLVWSFIEMGQHGSGGQDVVGGTIISDIISGIAIGLMLYGLKKERPAFLLPHLVLQVVWMVSVLVFVISAIFVLAVKRAIIIGQNNDQQHSGIFWVVFIGALLISVAIDAWYFSVTLFAYLFLKEKQMCGLQKVNKAAVKSGVPPPYSAC